MDACALADLMAEQLAGQDLAFEKSKIRPPLPRFGAYYKKALLVEVIFRLPTPIDNGQYNVARSMFPCDLAEGGSLILGSLDYSGYLTVRVYFSLPDKSAEMFPEDERNIFIEKMARFHIASRIKSLLTYEREQELTRCVPDPRHPKEILWEKRRQAVYDFFRGLLPDFTPKQERSFREYM